MQASYPITCPHCWQTFDIAIDCSIPDQTFVYDCEVCCNPLEITCQIDDGRIAYCDASSLEQ